MSFFKTDKSAQANQDNNGAYFAETGIYPVKIDFISVTTNQQGARSLDLHVEYEGSNLWLYGLRLDNNDLSENFQRKTFNKLCVVLGIDNVNNPTPMKKKAWVLGQGETLSDYNVLNEFTNKKVLVKVRKEFSLYNGELKEKNLIDNFYRFNDKASASEVISNSNIGTQYAKDMEKLAITYKDGLTAEIVAELKKKSKSGNSTPQPKVEVNTDEAF